MSLDSVEPRTDLETSLAQVAQRRVSVQSLASDWAADVAVALLPEWHPGYQTVRAMILDHALAALWPLVRLDTTEAQIRAALVNLRRADLSWKQGLLALRNHEVREHNRTPKKLQPGRVFEIAERYSLLRDRLFVADVDERSWRRAVSRAEKTVGRKAPRAARASRS